MSQTRNEIENFFGNHGGAKLFTKLFVEAAPGFAVSINESDPNSITNSPHAYNLMRYENYENKPAGADNKDLAADFTDFIVQTALFHRSVDMPSGRSATADAEAKVGTEFINGPAGTANTLANVTANGNIGARDVSAAHTAYTNGGAALATVLNAMSNLEKLTMALYDNAQTINTNVLASGVSDLAVGALDTTIDAYTADANTRRAIKADFRNLATLNIQRVLNGEQSVVSQAAAKAFVETQANQAALAAKIQPAVARALREAIDRNLPRNTQLTTGSNLVSLFANWDNLSTSAKQFYGMYLNLYKDGAKVPASEISQINGANIGSYRVNLVKKTIGTQVPRFVDLIPKVPASFVNAWYTNQVGQTTKTIVGGDVDYLKTLYTEVYTQSGNFNYYPTAWDQAKASRAYFHLDVDKYFRARIFDLKRSLKAPSVPTGPVFSMTDKNIWQVDETGRLYKDESGRRVFYDEAGEGTLNLLRKNFNCYSTYAANNNDAQCAKYMNECLLDDSADGLATCAELWDQADFYDVARTQIANMHPLVIRKTLQKFGFRAHEVFDSELGMSINKIESVEHWRKHTLARVFDNTQHNLTSGKKTMQQIIEGNAKLLDYLQLLVECLNSNPNILNKNVRGQTEEAVGRVARSEYAEKLGIKMYRAPPRETRSLIDYNNMRFVVQSRPATAPSARSQVQTLAASGIQLGSIPYRFQFGQVGQLGGGSVGAADTLAVMIGNLVQELREKGKTLSRSDTEMIEQKASRMREIESELVKYGIILQQYNDLVNTFDDYRSQVISIADIERIANKEQALLNLRDREEGMMVKILGSLEDLKRGHTTDFVSENAYTDL